MQIKKIASSRTNIVIIALFLIHGITGIKEFIPMNLLPLIDAVLTFAAIYFRINPKVDFSPEE